MNKMLKIQKILNELGPLSSRQVVERFIKMLSAGGVHTLSDKEIERILMFVTSDCREFLEESLTAYLKHGIVSYRKQKEKTISSSTGNFFTDNLPLSLKEQGYEYGLSDW